MPTRSSGRWQRIRSVILPTKSTTGRNGTAASRATRPTATGVWNSASTPAVGRCGGRRRSSDPVEEVVMPAVTVEDITALPRIPLADPSGVQRPVRAVTSAPSGFEGEGFPVRRAFAGVALEALDPFVHMDQMGEVEYAPGEPKGTPWHPHRGFETVTYMLDGIIEHQDSNGGGGVISNGDTQWMTAGSGLLHIETPPEHLVLSGGLFHGIQLWVNLPGKDKMVAPRYQSLEGDQVTLLSSPDGGALVRLIAGDLAGHRGPGATYTPISYAHASINSGAQLVVPWNPAFNALVYVLSGRGYAGADGHPVEAHQLVMFGDG